MASNKDQKEFLEWLQKRGDGAKAGEANSTMNQQQQLASKEAQTAKPVATPAVPVYQPYVSTNQIPGAGVQQLIGQADIGGGIAMGNAARGMVQSALQAAQPVADALIRPGDTAWQRNLALGGMDNLSQQELLMAREQANIDAAAGRNPYDNMPMAPDTGKTVWWNVVKDQGTGTTTANYVIKRAETALERGDYKGALKALEYGTNNKMSEQDRQILNDYMGSDDFGFRKDGKQSQKFVWQVIDAAGQYDKEEFDRWAANNLTGDMLKAIQSDYGIIFDGSNQNYVTALREAMGPNGSEGQDHDRKRMMGMVDALQTKNASTAFWQRGGETLDTAEQDEIYGKAASEYRKAQTAKWIADWLADRLQVETNGVPMDLNGGQTKYAVEQLRKLGYNVPDLDEGNYRQVMRNLQTTTGNRAAATRTQLERAGYDTELMGNYLTLGAESEFYAGLQKVQTREMSGWEKVAASVISVPFAVYAQPVISLANVLKTMGNNRDVTETGTFVPVGKLIDNPSAAMRNEVSEDMGGLGKFTYNALMSSVDSFVGAATLGNAYTITMGLSVMGDEIQNAMDRGASPKTALAYGITKGVIEMVTEKASTEQIVATLRSQEAKTFVQRLIDTGVNGATEGSEEIASDILGGIADAYLLKSNSEYNRRVDELVRKGHSKRQAEAIATAELAGEIMESGAAGLISGILGEGMAQGAVMARGNRKNSVDQILAMQDSEDKGERSYYKAVADAAGIKYTDSEKTARQKMLDMIDADKRAEKHVAKWQKQLNKAVERAYEQEEKRVFDEAPAEVPGLTAKELMMDTVEEDTKTILRGAQNAQTSIEAAGAVKMAEEELAWIANAKALGRIDQETADRLAEQLEDMVEYQRQAIRERKFDRQANEQYGVDAADMNADDINDMEEIRNETESGTEGIADGSEWLAGVDSDQQAGTVGEDAGRAAEEPGYGQRYRGALRISRETEAAGAEEQSAKEIGITGGSQNKTIRVVPDSVIEAHEELKAIRDEAKANGNEVVMVTGKLQVMQGGRAVLADGLYQPNDDGTATIYLQADNLNRSAVQIYNHETFHRLVADDRSLMEDILDSLLEQNDYDEEKVRRQAWRYAQAYGWIYGKPTADMSEAELDELAEQYLEEYFADAYGEIRRNGVDMEPAVQAVAKNRESLETARNSRVQEQVGRMLETVDAPGEGGVVENENGKGVVAYNGNGNAMLSISTYWSDGRSILKEWLDKNAGAEGYISRTEADEMLERMDEIVKVCESMKGKSEEFDNWSYADVVVDEKGHPVFSVVKANGEYAMNLDFSLVCKKRRTLDMVLNELCENGTMNQISEMGEAALAYINDLIRQRGFEIACGLCFVDAKRYRQGIVADEFVTMYNRLVWSLIHGKQQSIGFFNYGKDKNATQLNEKLEAIGTIDQVPDSELNFEEIDRIIKEHDDADEAEGKNTAGSVEYRIAKALRNNPKMRKLAARSDFMATGGLDNTKIRNPELMKLFNSKKGTGGPKAAESDVQYLSDVIRSGKFEAAAAYAVGGVRIQSFSDYVPRLVVDYCQMIADMAAKKLPAHAYTKEALFALQFGLTGAMINMSLVPAYQEGGIAPGLDADGNYAWRDGQSFGSTDSGDKTYGMIRKILQKAGVKGMPSKLQREGSARWGFELAKVIQAEAEYGKNCGTIAIGVSMWQILKMMDDPAIRMIIPYHKSGINHLVASFNWVDTFADFTGIQNTRYRGSGKNLSKEDAGKFDFNAAVQKHDGDAKAATDEYLKWCEENDYIPKFSGEYREDSNVDWDAIPAEWQQYFEIIKDKKGTKVISHLDQHPEYYKLLIDFHSYDEAGNVTKQGAVQLKMPGKDSSFGSFAELVEAGLEADQELADRQKKEVPEIAEEIRSIAQAGVVDALGKTASTVLEEAQDMERKGYSTENILGRTGWSRDENGKWVLDEGLKQAMELERQGVAAKEIKKQTNWEPTKNGWKRGWKAGKRLSNEEMTERRMKGQKFSTAEMDEEYLAAVERGDMKTAQKIVLAAAKAAGYDSETIYHGTQHFGFTEFDLEKMDDGRSIFATNDRDVAATYSGKFGLRRIQEIDVEDADGEQLARMLGPYLEMLGIPAECEYNEENDTILFGDEHRKEEITIEEAKEIIVEQSEQAEAEGKGNYELVARLGKAFVVEADGKNWNRITDWTENADQRELDGMEWDEVTTREVADWAWRRGYNSVVFKDLVDIGDEAPYGFRSKASNVYIVFDPRDIKSVDPVTYDDEGNVIPLSQRFDNSQKDIRFSPAEDGDEMSPAEWYAQQQEGYRAALFNSDIGERIDTVQREQAAVRTATEEKIRQAQKMNKQQLRAAMARTEADLRAIKAAQRAGIREDAGAVVDEMRGEESKILRNRMQSLQETLDITKQELARRQAVDRANRKEKARQRAMDNAVNLTQGQLQRKIAATEDKIKGMEAAIAELEGQAQAQETVRNEKKKLQEELAAYREAKRLNADENRKAEQEARRQEKRKNQAERAKSNLVTDVLNLFSIPVKYRSDVAVGVATAADIMLRDGKIDANNINTLMAVLIESGEETVQAEQYLKQVRQDMRGQRIYVSPETRTEFGDEWAAFRKRAWANGIILTSDESDGGIDRTQMDIFGNETETSGKEALEALLQMVENGRNETITTRESMQRKQQEYGWRVEDQIAELRQKLLRQLDRFAAAAELEIEIAEANEAEQLEQDRKLREKISAKAERQARKDVFTAVKRLERLARTADPKSQKAAQEVLKDIDTIARRVTPAGLEDLREMEMICREMMEGDNHFAPDQYMEARLARLQQYQIDDMPIEQVRQLAQDVLAVTYAIESRNKMLSKMKYDERDKMANAVGTEISRTKGMKSGKLREWLRLEHIRPRTFFGMISGYREDGATMSVAQALEDGQTKQMEYIRGAQRLFDEFTADKANQKWLKTASGKDAVWEDVLGVRMTPMMKVSLYMHSQNIQNRYHITEGAVVVPNEMEYRKGNISNAYATGQKVQFTEMQLREIASSLNEQEIAFAKLLKKYYDEYSAARINETSMVLLGYERATTKNYFHIRVQNDSVANVDSYLATAQDGTLEGIGSVAKSRQQRSNKPILLEDANLATLDHIDKMAKYTGLAIPLRDLAAITTFIPNPKMELDEKAPAKLWAAAYEARNNYVTVSEWIKRKWTAAAGEYLDRLKNDLQLPSNGNDIAGTLLGKLRGKLAGATLAFNPAVALSQTASYPGAVQTVGVAALANGLKLWHRVDTKLIEKYSPLLWYRTGGAEEELQNLSKQQGLEKKLPWLFGWIESMDKATVKRIWAACEWRVQHDTSFRPGDQADIDAGRDVYYMEVAKLFNRCVYDTQPNYSTFQRTQISRTPSDMVKFLTMYKTVPLQYYNMMFEAAGRLSTAKERYKASQTSRTKRELKQARIFAARTFGGILTANVVYVAMKALVKGLLTGKVPEDEDGEMTFGAVAKQFGLDLADTYAGSIIGLSEIVGAVEEWTGLKDAVYSNGDSNVVIDTVGRVKDAAELIFGAGSTEDLLKGIKELAIYGGKFLGVPTGNMEKYILGLVRRISPEAGLRYDNLWTEIDKKAVKKQKTGEEFRAALEILMDNRTDGVTDETINEIQRLWEAGFDAVPTAMPSDITTGDDGEKLKLGWGENSAYRQAWNETVTGTIDRLIETDMYQEAGDKTRAAMIKSLYTMAGYAAKLAVYPDYEPNSNEKWIEKAVEAAETGIDVAEYIAYREIEKNLDGKDKNGESVDGLKDERIRELIGQTGWNGEQKAVVYGDAASEAKNEKLDKLYAAGLNFEQANSVASAGSDRKAVLAALEISSLSDTQRYQAAMVYAGEKEAKKLDAGMEFGVKPSQYAEVLRNADEDGNGSLKQQEVTDYISGMNISIQQKAYLWQMVTDGKNGTKNPFGQTFGADFYQWMHRNDE